MLDAIAEYVGVEREQVVLGAGADDLILLCARAFAGPGDTVCVLDQPTYPLLAIASWLAGADVGDERDTDAAFTFACRPHNPRGSLGAIPDQRPLVRIPRKRVRDPRTMSERERLGSLLECYRTALAELYALEDAAVADLIIRLEVWQSATQLELLFVDAPSRTRDGRQPVAVG